MRCRYMVCSLVARIAAIALLVSSAGYADDVQLVRPYEAKVTASGAPVLSGPGMAFYAVDTLAEGDIVEVYREQPGGWLGIRPPADSFSWIFGRHLKLLDDGMAQVDKDDVASRIGSRTSDQRNAVQVRLKKGEIVEILGAQTHDGQTWYRIAPPAGEFRWIHERHVVRTDFYRPEPAAAPVVTVPVADGSTAKDMAPITLVADTQQATEESWRAVPPGTARPAADGGNPPVPQDVRASAAGVEGASRSLAPPDAAASSDPVAPPSPPAAPVPDALARQLMDLEMRLSRIVSEPPTSWQIAPLASEGQKLLAQTQAAADREAIQTTLTKIDRFAAIGRRYQELRPINGNNADPRTTGGLASIAPIGPPPNLIGPDGQRYDAVGVLRPVVSKRAGAPQFALLNERGQVVSFVTPTPDMNLQPYIGHQIGVTGTRGYIPEFQRAHVTAGRVAPLAPILR